MSYSASPVTFKTRQSTQSLRPDKVQSMTMLDPLDITKKMIWTKLGSDQQWTALTFKWTKINIYR